MLTITLTDKSVLIAVHSELAYDLYNYCSCLDLSPGGRIGPGHLAAVVHGCRANLSSATFDARRRVPVPRRAFEVTIFSSIFPIEITKYYTVAIQQRHQIIIIIIKHFRERVPPLLSAGGT